MPKDTEERCPECGTTDIWLGESPDTMWWNYCPACNFEWNPSYDWKGEEAEGGE